MLGTVIAKVVYLALLRDSWSPLHVHAQILAYPLSRDGAETSGAFERMRYTRLIPNKMERRAQLIITVCAD